MQYLLWPFGLMHALPPSAVSNVSLVAKLERGNRKCIVCDEWVRMENARPAMALWPDTCPPSIRSTKWYLSSKAGKGE